MLDKIIYPSPHFSSAATEIWEWISNSHYILMGIRLFTHAVIKF